MNQVTPELAPQGPFQDSTREEQEFYPHDSSQCGLLTRQPVENIQPSSLSILQLTLSALSSVLLSFSVIVICAVPTAQRMWRQQHPKQILNGFQEEDFIS